ncbi:hypothetical protein CPB84DRAFT_1674153, partial [Gymnopilus junonius]
PDVKPSNYIHVSRANGGVKGVWVLDPSLVIPSALLPPLSSGETEDARKNLILESKNGNVHGDVYTLPLRDEPTAIVKHRQHISILAKSWNGNVTAKIHDLQSHPNETRLPLHISCTTTNGNVNVYLPRSFEGVINMTTRNGVPRFSEAVQSLVVPISDISGVHRSFLGHFDASKWEGDTEWVGDELNAGSSNGQVKVFFEDEAGAQGPSGKSQGFFERLFRF